MTYKLTIILKEGSLNEKLYLDLETTLKQMTKDNGLVVYKENDGDISLHVENQDQAIEYGIKIRDLYAEIVNWNGRKIIE